MVRPLLTPYARLSGLASRRSSRPAILVLALHPQHGILERGARVLRDVEGDLRRARFNANRTVQPSLSHCVREQSLSTHVRATCRPAPHGSREAGARATAHVEVGREPASSPAFRVEAQLRTLSA